MKNCIRPPYRKLKPLESGFIENSNFENNKDPCRVKSCAYLHCDQHQLGPLSLWILNRDPPLCEKGSQEWEGAQNNARLQHFGDKMHESLQLLTANQVKDEQKYIIYPDLDLMGASSIMKKVAKAMMHPHIEYNVTRSDMLHLLIVLS